MFSFNALYLVEVGKNENLSWAVNSQYKLKPNSYFPFI